jgi:hypothetical protein
MASPALSHSYKSQSFLLVHRETESDTLLHGYLAVYIEGREETVHSLRVSIFTTPNPGLLPVRRSQLVS